MGSTTLLIEHLFVVLLFLEVAWSDTFDFTFSGFFAIVPYGPLEVEACMLHLSFLGNPIRAHLAHTFLIWSPFCQLHHIWIFLVDLLCILWAFSDMLAWRVLYVLRSDFLAHSGRSLALLPRYLLLGTILFAKRDQWPRKQLVHGTLFWDRVLSSSSPSHCLLKKFLACSSLSQNSA